MIKIEQHNLNGGNSRFKRGTSGAERGKLNGSKETEGDRREGKSLSGPKGHREESIFPEQNE